MKFYNFESLVEEVFEEFFSSLTDYQKVSMWNEYCDDNKSMEDHIYDMYELDDVYSGLTPTKLLDSLSDDFKTIHKYFKDGIYGGESFDSLDEEIAVSDLRNWFSRWGDCLSDDYGFQDWCEDNEYSIKDEDDDDTSED